jgi:hypothetical protein
MNEVPDVSYSGIFILSWTQAFVKVLYVNLGQDRISGLFYPPLVYVGYCVNAS